MMKTQRDILRVAIGALLFSTLLFNTPLQAQGQSHDTRWLPWLGCWEPVIENDKPEAPILCIRPTSGHKDIELTMVSDGKITSQNTIKADGISQKKNREGCQGWEKTSFSNNSNRIYHRAEFVCDNGKEPKSTGIMSMISPYEWIDVRTLDVGTEIIPWVIKYHLYNSDSIENKELKDFAKEHTIDQKWSRIGASSAITIEDVIEASSHVDPTAVEAWIAEQGDQFALNAKKLVSMADAGVPENVIDIVVAVSYPEQFSMNRNSESDNISTRSSRQVERIRYGYSNFHDPFYYDPFFLSPFYSPYTGYGYYSPYRYGSYGYGYGSGFGYGYGAYGSYYRPYRPTIIVNRFGQKTGRYRNNARAVKGRGYTQGSPRSSNVGNSSSGGRKAVRRSSPRPSPKASPSSPPPKAVRRK